MSTFAASHILLQVTLKSFTELPSSQAKNLVYGSELVPEGGGNFHGRLTRNGGFARRADGLTRLDRAWPLNGTLPKAASTFPISSRHRSLEAQRTESVRSLQPGTHRLHDEIELRTLNDRGTFRIVRDDSQNAREASPERGVRRVEGFSFNS